MKISLKNFNLHLAVLIMVLFIKPVYSQTATYNITITVMSSSVITDAANDALAGKNPLINNALNIDPDIGGVNATDSGGFRIRTNENSWMVLLSVPGNDLTPPNAMANQFTLTWTQTAGSNAMAGTFSGPFPGPLMPGAAFPPPASMFTLASGASMTSSARDNTNTNNYVQFDQSTELLSDFFYDVSSTGFVDLQYDLQAP